MLLRELAERMGMPPGDRSQRALRAIVRGIPGARQDRLTERGGVICWHVPDDTSPDVVRALLEDGNAAPFRTAPAANIVPPEERTPPPPPPPPPPPMTTPGAICETDQPGESRTLPLWMALILLPVVVFLMDWLTRKQLGS